MNTFTVGLLYCIASSICFYLPAHFFHQLEPWREDVENSQEVRFATILATIVILYFGTEVPAYAIFIRVSASTHPPQNGSKTEENVRLGIKSAWQTFLLFRPYSFLSNSCKGSLIRGGFLWCFVHASPHVVGPRPLQRCCNIFFQIRWLARKL